ncbi:myosin heavy chain, clone 203-like [Chironomus tepperi]|uniref:myosin heavy chain, clone 203-like n=1 Tax=Chironomus tepperi TaxID=113505 RepID=UPI00391F00E3
MSKNLMCDKLVNLIYLRKDLEQECDNVKDEILDEKARKQEAAENDLQEKLPKFYKDLIEELNEKLDVFKLIAYDLGKDAMEFQNKAIATESLAEKQEKILKKIDRKNSIFERQINEKIHEMREKYLLKLSELNQYKGLYIETENLLQESMEALMDCDKELNSKAKILKQYQCCIKKYKENKASEAEKEALENLKAQYEIMLGKSNNLLSLISCIQEKICKINHESELTRKIIRRKLRVVKDYDNWSVDHMLERKRSVEADIENSRMKLSKEDFVIKELRNNIEALKDNIEISEFSIKKLGQYSTKLSQNKSTGRRYLNLSKIALKAEQKVVLGRDHMGSTIVIKC